MAMYIPSSRDKRRAMRPTRCLPAPGTAGRPSPVRDGSGSMGPGVPVVRYAPVPGAFPNAAGQGIILRGAIGNPTIRPPAGDVGVRANAFRNRPGIRSRSTECFTGAPVVVHTNPFAANQVEFGDGRSDILKPEPIGVQLPQFPASGRRGHMFSADLAARPGSDHRTPGGSPKRRIRATAGPRP